MVDVDEASTRSIVPSQLKSLKDFVHTARRLSSQTFLILISQNLGKVYNILTLLSLCSSQPLWLKNGAPLTRFVSI